MTTYTATPGNPVSDTTITAADLLLVSSGGLAISNTLDGGAEYDSSGATDSATRILGGSEQHLYNGARTIGDSISSGGRQGVYGRASGTIITSGGVEWVYSGGVAVGTMVSSGGRDNVSSGGATSRTIVSNGGFEYVSASAFTSGAIVSSGGNEVVYSGGTTRAAVISQGGHEVVYGTASGSIITSGGSNTVSSGGVSSNGMVSNGGLEAVFYSGLSLSDTINSGGSLLVYHGGVASGTIVSSGGTVSALGKVSNTMVENGGSQIVFAGGVSVDTVMKGTYSNGVYAPALETVSSGGIAISAVVSKYGEQFVYGTTSGTNIVGGGEELVYSGSVVSNTLVSGSFSAGQLAVLFLSGGVAYGTIADNYAGVDENNPDTTLYNTVLNSGAVLTLVGTSYDTVLNGGPASAGLQLTRDYVYGGAIAYGTTVNSGAQEEDEGGVTHSTIVNNGGEQAVQSGGVVYQTTVNNGGVEQVGNIDREGLAGLGTASGTILNSGGVEDVITGGVAYGTQINAGGHEVVSGGTEYGGKIAGGVLELSSDATLSSGVTFSGSGGQLLIDTTIMPTAVISAFAVGDTIDLAAVAYSSANKVSVNSPGVVTVSAGGSTYNLNISGAMVGATNFSLSSATSGGTILKDPPANSDIASIGPDLSSASMNFLTPVNGGTSTINPSLTDLSSLHETSAANVTKWPASSEPLWGTASASLIGGSQLAHLAALPTTSSLTLPAMSGAA